MYWMTGRMLVADPVKYFGIVLGGSCASLLICRQTSIFCGLLWLTSSQIRDVGADIWVMDSQVEQVDAIEALVDNAVERVRGAEGVLWAVPYFKGITRGRLRNGDFEQCLLLGLDDATLVGAPADIILGDLEVLRRPDAVIMDVRGYRRLYPDQPLELGRSFEINDQRAVIVGTCRISRTFQTFPACYCCYK